MKSLKLRPGVHYAPVEGGVYFSSARATFVVRGPSVLFRVVDACVPLLEDGADVDALVTAIGAPNARPLIVHLVDTLDSRGLVLHLERLLGPQPGRSERERFPEALAYLETHCDDPYTDFRRVRNARVLLAGPADALGPAIRGLLRAGVGQVQVASPEPERLASLAARHPEVRLLLCTVDAIPALIVGSLPQAAVIFSEDNFPTDAIRQLPAACVAIPVRVGKDLAIVGPAIHRADDPRGAEALWARAVTWSQLDGDDLLVRPSGDLLAGALAGQVALDALIGRNRGRIHVVHGPDLTSDAITPCLAGPCRFDPPIDLGPPARSPKPVPAPGEAPAVASEGGWMDSVSRPWAGLFRLRVPGDLPQMPMALTLADGRGSRLEGRVLGFGPDQATSTTEAGLAALRQHCSTVARSDDLEARCDRGIAAAGLDRTGWLLDGALRLLAGEAGSAGLAGRAGSAGEEHRLDWLGIDDADARRLWRTLEEHELTPVGLTSASVPGFGWTLVSVHDQRNRSCLAAGWGHTPSVGATAALSAALATVQVRRTVDAGFHPGPATAGFLGHLHRPHQDRLEAAVRQWLGTSGRRLSGRRLPGDAVSGPLGAWCGMVRLDG